MHLCQCIFQSSKQFLKSISGMAFSSLLNSLLSTQNDVPGTVFYFCSAARSRSVTNHVNTVVEDDKDRVFREMVPKNQCIMSRHIIVVQNKKLSCYDSGLFKWLASLKCCLTLKNTVCRQFVLVERIKNAQHNKCRHYKNRKIYF